MYEIFATYPRHAVTNFYNKMAFINRNLTRAELSTPLARKVIKERKQAMRAAIKQHLNLVNVKIDSNIRMFCTDDMDYVYVFRDAVFEQYAAPHCRQQVLDTLWACFACTVTEDAPLAYATCKFAAAYRGNGVWRIMEQRVRVC